jgi:hypothetical protein
VQPPIEALLGTFAERHDSEAMLPVLRPRKRMRNRPRFDVRGRLQRMTGVDLAAVEGLDEPTALTISSEIGLDTGWWPPVKHFRS